MSQSYNHIKVMKVCKTELMQCNGIIILVVKILPKMKILDCPPIVLHCRH